MGYRAYELLRGAGDERVHSILTQPKETKGVDAPARVSCNDTVGAFALKNSRQEVLDIFLYNHVTSTCDWTSQQSPCSTDPIQDCIVRVLIGNVDVASHADVTVRRIDRT